LIAKAALPPKNAEQSHLIFTTQTDIGKTNQQADIGESEDKKRSYPRKPKKLLANRRNDPIGGRYADAPSNASEYSFAERGYGVFSGFTSASSAQHIYH
jgi:hypothetical protein